MSPVFGAIGLARRRGFAVPKGNRSTKQYRQHATLVPPGSCCHFATTTSISPVASLTVAAPHSVALPFASNLQPKVPAFLAAHCPALRLTRYQPEPTGLFAGLPLA